MFGKEKQQVIIKKNSKGWFITGLIIGFIISAGVANSTRTRQIRRRMNEEDSKKESLQTSCERTTQSNSIIKKKFKKNQ
jgi:Na+/glutamate symporter